MSTITAFVLPLTVCLAFSCSAFTLSGASICFYAISFEVYQFSRLVYINRVYYQAIIHVSSNFKCTIVILLLYNQLYFLPIFSFYHASLALYDLFSVAVP